MNPFLSSILSRFLIDRRGGHRRSVLARYRELLRVSSLPADEIRRYQDQRLADLLNHAAAHVTFWKQHLKKPVNMDNARGILAGLPVMERAAIQAEPSDFLSDESDGTNDDATGGSSGTPMKFLVDRETQIAREASLYWADHLAGWNYGDRIAMLWGSDKDVKSAAREMKLKFRWWIDNRRWYNAFNMGEDRMAEFHRAMMRFRPHIIVAYAGSLEIYARFLKGMIRDTGSEIRDPASTPHPAPRPVRHSLGEGGIPHPVSRIPHPASRIPYPLTALISSAEVLTPSMRETIESVFGKPVFNRYGNRECGAIAAEDGRGGLMVNHRDFIVEIDSPDPILEPGPILITYFANRAMPFIRYNTGDLGVWVEGEEGKRIARIVGRQGDTIRTKDGKLIHGEYFTHLMYRARGVREFQFVQESLTQYQLLLVAERFEDEKVIEGIRADILEAIGADAEIEVRYVESIPVLASGKRKFTLSRI